VSVVSLGRLSFWHGDWAWGPRYVAPLVVVVAPLCWLLWERLAEGGRAARYAAGAAFLVLVSIQAVPIVAYPIETYFSLTVQPLSEAGLLVTRPPTSPPLAADHDLLYFTVETSPLVRLAQALPAILADRQDGPRLRSRLAVAALVPLLALAFILLQARRSKGSGT
jgi:hypothetical protein